MNRELLEDLHQYLEEKEVRDHNENHLLNQLIEELPYFQIAAISREDLEGRGFETKDVDDEDMRQLASKLRNDYYEQLFWKSMECFAEDKLDIPRPICPKCGNRITHYEHYGQIYYCHHCNKKWQRAYIKSKNLKRYNNERNS